MRAAVLSCGPSLPHTWAASMRWAYGFVVGVNTAAFEHPVDVWCAADVPMLEAWPAGGPLDRPPAFIPSDALGRLARTPGPRFPLFAVWEAQETPGLKVETWRVFSATAALVLAGTRPDVRQVDVYGADMRGDLDHRGQAVGRKHAQRWLQERRFWGEVVLWLEGRGVAVQRRGR